MSRPSSLTPSASRILGFATIATIATSLGACSGSDSDGNATGGQGGGPAQASQSAEGGEGGSPRPSAAQGGDGGSDDPIERDIAPPLVRSFSPEDGTLEVERDVVIAVELSEPLEPTRVPGALRVIGPDGPIAGKITVHGSSIRFEPTLELVLLGMYTIELDDTLADLSGNRLETEASASFRVRDGRWSQPEKPWGTGSSLSIRVSAGNRAGDLFVGGNDAASPPAVWGALYHAATKTWTPAETLASDESVTTIIRAAALGEGGVLSLAWWYGSPSSPGGWQRYDASKGFSQAPNLANTFNQLTAVSRDNRAMLVTQNEARFVYYAIWDLNRDSAGVQMERGDQDETLHALLATGSDFGLVASQNRESGSYLLSLTRYLGRQGFQAPEEIASSSSEQLGVLAASDELGNLMVVWSEGPELWARLYSERNGSWQPAERIGSGPAARWSGLSMAGGSAVASYHTHGSLSVAYYASEVGWLLEDRLSVGPTDSAVLAIDARGNALALWNRSGSFRRYVSGEGWLPGSSLELTARAGSVSAFSARDGEISVLLSDQSSTTESPVRLRFE